jgi:hypothetical protein
MVAFLSMKPFTAGRNDEAWKLWSLPKANFNEWRRQNDLPVLLSFFKTLPDFSKWQETQNIRDEDVLAVDHTSRLFSGNKIQYLVDYTAPGDAIGATERLVAVASPEALGTAGRYVTLHGQKAFTPYFAWRRGHRGTPYFRIPDDPGSQYTKSFEYMLRNGLNLAVSRAHLFRSQAVLKLGGLKITPMKLDGRNLDFVDLDGLRIMGTGWARETSVAYSSCQNIELIGTDKAFLTFSDCSVTGLSITSSRLQDLHFIDCRVGLPIWKDSRLFITSFTRSSLSGIDISNCELAEFYFDAKACGMSAMEQADLYKRLRVAYQQKGNRQETSAYYYRERAAELFGGLRPLVPRDLQFPPLAFYGSYRDLSDRLHAGQFTGKQAGRLVLGNVLAHLRVLYPRYLFRLIAAKIRSVGHLFDWAVWGFGERPARVFPWMIVVLIVFAAKYYILGAKDGTLSGEVLESIYCSAFNFSTMGCDHKSSIDSIEGMLGAILLGIMVAGFANRTRY